MNADINCKLRGGVTLEAVDFNGPITIERSGRFTYLGRAEYLHFTGSGYKGRMTSAALAGRFVTSNKIVGSVKGGPGSCRSASFAATYNPRAH